MRLIDADALIAQMESGAEQMESMAFKFAIYAAINEVRHAPTIEDHKTGEWIIDGEFIDCSVCRREKWSRVPYEDLVKRFRYCPNCGAKMEVKHE